MLDTLSFSRLDLWRQKNWSAKTAPQFMPDYCIVARLKIVDKDFWIEGAVLSLTSQTALFRESSRYVLKRQNEEVVLEIESEEYAARLFSTHIYGYQLEFMKPLPEERVADIRERWRIES